MTDVTQIYGTFGGTPSEKAAQTSGAKPFGVSASPNTFGAQVGEARQQEGAVFRDIGEKSMDYAMKYTGMVNQTIANEKAEQFTLGLGELTETLKSKKGNAAAAYMPEYIKSITELRKNLGTGIPNQAAMAFDSLSRVGEAQAIVGGHSYAGTQAKEAHYKSTLNGIDSYVMQSGREDIANSTEAMAFNEGNIAALTNQKYLNSPGTVLNPATGMVDFLKTPEGEAAQDEMKRELEKYIGDAQLNRFSTLTQLHGVEKAYSIYNEAKEKIPPATQAQLEAYFVPRVRDARAKGISGSVMEDAMRDYYGTIKSPEAVKQYNTKMTLAAAVFEQESSSGANAVTSSAGAVGGMQITPDTWETWRNIGIVKAGEDINNPVDNKAAGARALQYYTDLYDGDVQRAMVAYFSGPGNVAPAGSPTPWIEDHSDGHKLTSEYVSEVSAKMGGQKQPPVIPVAADYLLNHYDDVLRRAAEYAEMMEPGDVEFANKARTYYEQKANDIIQQQKFEDFVARKTAIQALNGDMSKGQKPTTEDQLLNISPAVTQSLNAWRARDPEEYDKVVTKVITANSRRETDVNSSNYFRYLNMIINGDEVITEGVLHGLLGRTDGTGINMKDYQDLLEASSEAAKFDGWTDKLSSLTKAITSAGGNADGQADKRALAFLALAKKVRHAAEEKGIPVSDLINPNNANYIGNLTDNFIMSREQQISNAAKTVRASLPRSTNIKVGDVVMGRRYLGGDVRAATSWGPR